MWSAYKHFWQRYFDFGNSTKRAAFWWVVLINLIIGVGLSVIPSLSYLATAYSIATIIPNLSMTIRRLHDVGKRGISIFIALIPLAGIPLLIIFLASKSNRYNKFMR